MFYQCNALISLNLSNFDFSSVTTVELMFYECTNLEFIDISQFTHVATGTNNMFYEVKNNLVYCIKDKKRASFLIKSLEKDN